MDTISGSWLMIGKKMLIGVLVIPLFFLSLPASSAEAAVSNWQQEGISFYPTSPTDFSSAGFQQTVDHFKSLGFNTVTLIVQLYQPNVGSTDITTGGNTPTDAALASAIQYVHSQGMQVMLNIHLDPQDGQWRAYINPTDRATWYANYLAMLKHYGQIAQANNVESYCLGVELIDMASAEVNPDNTQEWVNMISQVRQIYHGKLTYDANWGNDPSTGEVPYIQFWSSLDFIGISAYYPLSGDGSVAQDESAWDAWNTQEIQPLAAKWNKPIVFTEVGYRSFPNAHSAPYDSWDTGSYDPQEQVNDYQALLDYWNKYPYMQGMDVWYQTSSPTAGGSGDTDYLVQNKPVEQTFQSWFQQSSTASSTGTTASSTPTTTSGPAPLFSSMGTAAPASVSPGQTVSFSGTVQNTGGAGTGENIDFEIYDASGHQAAQKIFSAQSFSATQSQTYTYNWTPENTGTYTFKIGVFNAAWNLLNWNDSVAQFLVGNSSAAGSTNSTPPISTSTSTSATSTPVTAAAPVLDIWWPTDGSTVSGVQPFKAMMENLALDAYSMFWQVDGGQLNAMSDNQTTYPHKEADVNVATWNWKGNGPYDVTFIAKDASGNTIAQKSAAINVSN